MFEAKRIISEELAHDSDLEQKKQEDYLRSEDVRLRIEEEKNAGQNKFTILEDNSGSFIVVEDSEVNAKLDELNSGLEGQQKAATVYSVGGLTPTEADEEILRLSSTK